MLNKPSEKNVLINMRKAWKFASVERRFYSLALSLDLPLLLLKGSRGFTLFFFKKRPERWTDER